VRYGFIVKITELLPVNALAGSLLLTGLSKKIIKKNRAGAYEKNILFYSLLNNEMQE
jgi:hypothetical protein